MDEKNINVIKSAKNIPNDFNNILKNGTSTDLHR